ncbi:MAG TPA: FAD-binding oxidoreductase, partial [Solirubrobacteraceae bacterium]
MGDTLLAALAAAVGDAHVLADDERRAPFEVDWTGRYRGRARAAVRPADAAEVAAVLAACRAHGAAVVPQGGNTGMVGAGVPRGGEVVLSLARLTALGAVDRAAVQVRAGAGVTLAVLQAHARAEGLDAGVDLGARDSATLGGLVATDAGGTHALRYGTVRARVAGLQAVLADGTIVDRPALLKDNAGYNLPALLIGSEGTLGV